MTWIAISDRETLAGLRNQETTCVRVVMLNSNHSHPTSSIDDMFKKGVGEVMDSPFDRKYEIHAYRTKPATTAVYEKNSDELIGAYVWSGEGNAVLTAHDHRLRILADMLDAHFNESGTQVNQKYEAESTCECCGKTYSTDEGSETHIADIDLGDGIRMEKRNLDANESTVILERHATDAQLKTMHYLIDYGAIRIGIMNTRRLGEEAIGEIVIALIGPNEEIFQVFPSGKMEAYF